MIEKYRNARVLIVDDEPSIRELLVKMLTIEGYACASAASGEDAVKLLENNEFHLVLTDILMSGMSGLDLLTFVKSRYRDIAVVMATGVNDRETAIAALEVGAYGYVIKPFDRNELLINVAGALQRRQLTILSERYERELEERVRERTREVREREEEVVLRLISAAGYRDDETGAHIRRIGLYSFEMAQALGWSSELAEQLRLAAPMHDVGKIGIPDQILRKPGPLTREEFEIMKTHTEIGARILDGSQVPMLQMARDIAYGHHERHDGSGYPRGLAGSEIPESCQIVAVVDVYDALVHDRVYRPAFSEEQALGIMMAGDGEHFGDRIFDCFLDLLPTMRRIAEGVSEDRPDYTLTPRLVTLHASEMQGDSPRVGCAEGTCENGRGIHPPERKGNVEPSPVLKRRRNRSTSQAAGSTS
jgi:putative two-component system response regulator